MEPVFYGDLCDKFKSIVGKVEIKAKIRNPYNQVPYICLGKQIQTSLRLISVSLSNVLYCIYDVSVVSRCTLYLNKILFTLSTIPDPEHPMEK